MSIAIEFEPVRTLAPADLLTRDIVKEFLRVAHDDDDALIDTLIAASVGKLDGPWGELGRALVTQTWRQTFESFDDPLRLPLAPVQSISSVKYYDTDDVEQTILTSVYALFSDSRGNYVDLAADQSWPTSVGSRIAPVSVTFVAGYGAATAVPPELVTAAKLYVAILYDEMPEATAKLVMTAYNDLIAPYRRKGPVF